MQTVQNVTVQAKPTPASARSTAAGESLRDRKRRAARNATQRAAVELCLEHGAPQVSVDMICERAGISARSFYNYFGTREAAILGDAKIMPSESHIEAYLAATGASEVETFARMLAQAWVDAQPDVDLFRLRRQLFDSQPDLGAQNFARVAQARLRYAEVALRRLEVTEPDLTPADRTIQAELIAAVALGALQVVTRHWVAAGTPADLDRLIETILPQVRRLTQTAH